MAVIPSKATLKFAKGETQSVNGMAEVSILVPGDPNPATNDGAGRYVAGGMGWFENPEHGDYLVVEVQKPDNTVVASYSDLEAAVVNQGWFIPKAKGYLEVKQITMLGFIPSGLYLVIRAYRASGAPESKFWCNVTWGKEE